MSPCQVTFRIFSTGQMEQTWTSPLQRRRKEKQIWKISHWCGEESHPALYLTMHLWLRSLVFLVLLIERQKFTSWRSSSLALRIQKHQHTITASLFVILVLASVWVKSFSEIWDIKPASKYLKFTFIVQQALYFQVTLHLHYWNSETISK